MNRLNTFSKKAFTRIAFCMLLFVAACDAIIYWGFYLSAAGGVLPKILFFKQLLPVSAGLWIFFTFFLWAVLRSLGKNILSREPAETKKPESPDIIEKREENKNKRLFLHLLSILQRDARFMDFVFEKLDQFEDAQIGAAVRNIHENSYKTISKYLSPKPVIDNDEGDTITIDKGFDPSAIKLAGNVTGEPPFQGVLRHKGWQAGELELPVLSERENSLIISPAEVEIK